MRSIVHLQPIIPHYREEFFYLLSKKVHQDIYIYENIKDAKESSFNISKTRFAQIQSKMFRGGILVYNPFTLIKGYYDSLVLMLNFTHITTWLLLLTKFLHRKKIILWGQGISVRRYLKEEKRPDWKLNLMIALADGVWFYMDKEKEQWQKLFPKKPMVALHNTLTGVDDMVRYVPKVSVEELKEKYGIKQKVVFIFCARFTANRRVDLLLKTINHLDSNKYGFVIIGAGDSKPDFSNFDNVYDFGAVYDTAVKQELFALADIYFQPGWVGLSIVEAMAYGKPIFTFERSSETLQCVEYSYIHNGENGLIFKNIDDCIDKIKLLSDNDIKRMGDNARNYVAKHLTIEQMVDNAVRVIDKVCETK